MAFQLSQFLWGFEVVGAGTSLSQNNMLDFVDADVIRAATLNPGVYTADELAAEVQRAMRVANVANQNNTCAFNYSTLKFTLGGTAGGTLPFTLKFLSGANASIDCSGLLGFDATADKAAAPYESTVQVGVSPHSTASRWLLSEPIAYSTPVIGQQMTSPTVPAKQTERSIVARQYITDGMTVDSVYFGTLKKVRITFKALTATEQEQMEKFLDWITKFKRFTWQPDSGSVNGVKLVLANPKEIANAYEWLARPETGYGTLTFYEQMA